MRKAFKRVGLAVSIGALVMALFGRLESSSASFSPSPIVDKGAYDLAVDRYSACLAEAGFALVNRRSDETTPALQSWLVPAEAVESGTDEKCYSIYLESTDRAWQAISLPAQLTADDIRKCALERGFETSGRDITELVLEFTKLGIDVCG